VESEQYAAPTPRRPVLTRAGSALAPALVLCALAGVAGQVHRFSSAYTLGGGQTPPPLSLRVGYLLVDPSATTQTLAPTLAVLTLTGLNLLRPRTAPVSDSVRRAGAILAGLLGIMGLVLVVVVVVWVLTTHGSVGSDAGTSAAGTDSSDAIFQVDPWDTLLVQGGLGLLAAVVGAGGALLLTTPPAAAAAPQGPDAVATAALPAAASGDSQVPDETEGPPVRGSSALTRWDPTAGSSPDEVVVLASPPVVDLGAFRRPDSPASSGAHESPGGTEGYLRPPERSRDAT